MSLVLSADGQNLDSGDSTTLWTGAQSFTLAVWFKKANDLYAGIFGVFRSSIPEYTHTILRFNYGSFDHGVKLDGADLRMDNSGLLTSGWNLAVLTINNGVEQKSYINGTLQRTMANATYGWSGPASRIIVGSHTLNTWNTGRGKIAHAALWDTVLSAAQVADLWNGGAGGAGKSPTAVASANLRAYLPLISNATDETGTFTLTATGAPIYDGADNPNVEASGPADTTAPTLSSASVTSVGTTTATGNVTTDEGNGTLYAVVSTSATAPSAAQVQAGQAHTGATATWSGNQSVSSAGAKTFSITGLSNSTAYYFHAQHKDAAANNSTVSTSAQFTTTALGTITITDVYDFTTGALKDSQTGVTAIINNPTTGALVVKLTGLTTTAGADMTITDAALTASTSYRVTLVFGDGSEGTWVFTAS